MGAVHIGEAIGRIVGDIERDNPSLSASAMVKSAWNNIANDDIAAHVVALFVVPQTQESELIVYTDTTIAAADLNMQTEILRLKLNIEIARMRKEAGFIVEAETVKTLRFAVSKQQYISKKKKKSASQRFIEEDDEYKSIDPLPLNDDEIARLGEVSAGVEDEDLRQAAFKAAKANLEWDKGLRAAGKQ